MCWEPVHWHGKYQSTRYLSKLSDKKTGEQADECHVGRIVKVEELAEPAAAASLVVVHRQQWYCQPAGQVDHAVGRAVEDEEGNGVERDNQHHPEHLLVEITPIPPDHEYGQRGCTTPVGCAGEQTGHDGNGHFLPSCQLLHVPHLEQYQTPEERPGDTGGIEEQVVERVEARHIEVAEGEVAHHGQYEQTAQVTAEVVRVVITLGDEEDHHRSCQAPDAMQEYLRWRLRLFVGLDAHPCQMINRHGDDGNDFQRVSVHIAISLKF